MPPRKNKATNHELTRTTRRSTRQTRSNTTGHGLPSVYREMLAEVPAETFDNYVSSPRSSKRRKLSDASEEAIDALFDSPVVSPRPEVSVDSNPDQKPQQIILDDFDGSDESDIEFEDVDIDHALAQAESDDDEPEREPLRLDLGKQSEVTPRKSIQRRKPLTKAERDLRLDVHKWHFLSLLLYQLSCNVWCENEQVHTILKPLVPRQLISLLHVDDSQPSYQRNHSFMKGIEDVCIIWRREWTITARGLNRAYWSDAVDAQQVYDETEDPIDFDDFKTAAQTRRGSRDLGAQMFCALLRSVAVDARLVSSLQVLPYSGEIKPQASTPSKSPYINAPAQSHSLSRQKTKKKKIVDSPYPIFWVEVFNSATTTWIPLDPLVRNTINKPKTQFEPPASDSLNSMSYVIAFEDDNTARDVTRRYTQWFNAKTRKSRVENTKGGDEWLAKALGVFRRRIRLPRDMVEDDQLVQRAAAEGMPKNVQDFRQHPVYVLERHIRRNEVIHPRREVGKITTGTAKIGKLEIVFRRQDVYLCRSADAWYRRGRDVKMGEQPLKRVMPTMKRGARSLSEDDENEEDREGVALYAEYQTQIYEPPPVVNGKIPKNAYGNLDVYVPSMVPADAVHIMHPLASQAAKVLGINYTEAVTGFDFKGRQGTAVINGCVIASEHTAALTTTIEALELQGTAEVQAERSKLILALWKRMLTALRIRERIEQDYGEKRDEADSEDESDSNYPEHKDSVEAGGFMLEADETAEKANEQIVNLQSMKNRLPIVLPKEVVQLPIKIVRSPHKSPVPEQISDDGDELFEDDSDIDTQDPNEGGGFLTVEDNSDTSVNDVGGGFIPSPQSKEEDTSGGFLAENEEEDSHPVPDSIPPSTTTTEPEETGGGFIPDEEAPPPAAPPEIQAPSPLAHKLREAAQSHTDGNYSNGDRDGGDDCEDDDDSMSATSLLSHDPEEDNDSEPEWLADAMEE